MRAKEYESKRIYLQLKVKRKKMTRDDVDKEPQPLAGLREV
jgi:hypothetical protein